MLWSNTNLTWFKRLDKMERNFFFSLVYTLQSILTHLFQKILPLNFLTLEKNVSKFVHLVRFPVSVNATKEVHQYSAVAFIFTSGLIYPQSQPTVVSVV